MKEMFKAKQPEIVEKVISKGEQIANSQRVGYLNPDECIFFCEMLKKVKVKIVEQPSGDVRLIRFNGIKFYSDKI